MCDAYPYRTRCRVAQQCRCRQIHFRVLHIVSVHRAPGSLAVPIANIASIDDMTCVCVCAKQKEEERTKSTLPTANTRTHFVAMVQVCGVHDTRNTITSKSTCKMTRVFHEWARDVVVVKWVQIYALEVFFSLLCFRYEAIRRQHSDRMRIAGARRERERELK